MDEILVKKYDNRRLYCVTEGRYVSLAEIRAFVQAGRAVRVIEKSSGRDITKTIMTQILLEERCELLPDYFFQMMIQAKPAFLEAFFRDVMPRMLEYFGKLQDSQPFPGAFPNPFQAVFPAAPALPAVFPWMPRMQNEPAPAAAPDDPAPRADAGPGDARMEALLKRLAELEQRVGPKKKR